MNPSIRRDARALGATHRFPCLTNTIRLAVLVVLLLAVGGCENMICWNYEEPREVGLKAYQQQRYADAAGAFRVAINKNSCDYESYYYLGCSLQSLRAYHEAIENYKASLDVMKVTYAGRMDMDFRLKTMDALASAIVHGDNHDAELTTMEDQARRQQSVWDYYELGKIYRLRGDADTAMQNYEHAAVLDNKNFPLLKEYGLYLELLGQQQKARNILWQAGSIDAKDNDVALALRRLGVVPGPSLRDATQLSEPNIPRGPIPPLEDIPGKLGTGGTTTTPPPTRTPTTPPARTPPARTPVQAPNE